MVIVGFGKFEENPAGPDQLRPTPVEVVALKLSVWFAHIVDPVADSAGVG